MQKPTLYDVIVYIAFIGIALSLYFLGIIQAATVIKYCMWLIIMHIILRSNATHIPIIAVFTVAAGIILGLGLCNIIPINHPIMSYASTLAGAGTGAIIFLYFKKKQ